MSSSCPIAPPFPTALKLKTFSLKAGTNLVRCHKTGDPKNTFPANSFNPNVGKRITVPEEGARFNPFPGAPATNIPTLYAATSLEAAALESIFHEVPHQPSQKYPKTQLAEWSYSELNVTRDLTLFELVNSRLRPLKVPGRQSITEQELIQTPPTEYPRTRTWACNLHALIPGLDGLAWRPRLGGTGTAYVFFGDRFKPDDLKILGRAISAADGVGYKEIERIAEWADIEIVTP